MLPYPFALMGLFIEELTVDYQFSTVTLIVHALLYICSIIIIISSHGKCLLCRLYDSYVEGDPQCMHMQCVPGMRLGSI